MSTPSLRAASSTLVPLGTVTGLPSTVRVTVSGGGGAAAGVAVSLMVARSCRLAGQLGCAGGAWAPPGGDQRGLGNVLAPEGYLSHSPPIMLIMPKMGTMSAMKWSWMRPEAVDRCTKLGLRT